MSGTAFPTVMVLDGGLGTELERRGCDLRSLLWSADALLGWPDVVEAVHADFLDAGADCITTASYQVSFEGFARAGLSAADTVRALKASMAIADAARRRVAGTSGRPAFVAASLGPYGAALANGAEYHGRYGVPDAELVAFHRSRLEHLQGGPIDVVACETVPSLQEARAMLQALAAFPHLRAWLAFTCADEWHTGSGEDIAEGVRLASQSPQVVAVGVNCTAPEHIGGLIDRVRASASTPIVVYPNAGQTWDATARAWTGRSSLHDYGALAADWHRRGASWLGGCCGISPEHIRQLRGTLEPNVTTGNVAASCGDSSRAASGWKTPSPGNRPGE